ncbi:MAG: hypothetical protein KDF57_05560, partial [Ottowia sp.]|nr:hypothetical protein [Ottowia sp.]
EGVGRTGKTKSTQGRCSTERQNALFHRHDSVRKKVIARPKRILEMPSDAITPLLGISIGQTACMRLRKGSVVFL